MKDGGFAMLDMYEFDKSLKITWIRKMLKNKTDWTEFPLAYKIDRMIYTGIYYYYKILSKTTNPFWLSVAQAYSTWFVNLKNHIKI